MDQEFNQDLRTQLPRDAYFHLVHVIRAARPPGDGTPEAIALRDRAAIAQAAALCPANAAEAAIAAQFVAANLQAMDCLRLANDPAARPDEVRRCTAQAASMMRQSQGAVRLLMRLQAARARRDANDAAASQAIWAEHIAESTMLDGMDNSLAKRQSPMDRTFETNARPNDPVTSDPAVEPLAPESPSVGQCITDDGFETIMRPDPVDAAPAPDDSRPHRPPGWESSDPPALPNSGDPLCNATNDRPRSGADTRSRALMP